MQRQPFEPANLDAGIKTFLDDLTESGSVGFDSAPVEEMRALFVELATHLDAPNAELEAVSDHQAPGPDGEITVRLYVPKNARPNGGALVFFHGGGWVIGNLQTHDSMCRRLANHGGVKVISVDYRLAPEHKYPAAIDDAIAAYTWVCGEAEFFDIDRKQIAVGGDSAGGALAAIVSNELAKTDLRPAMQVLIYPVTQIIGATLSRAVLADGYFLSANDIKFFGEQYLSEPGQALLPKVSPILHPDLSNVPPALIVTAGFDPLCDEGLAYAEKLRWAGVGVEEIHAPSLIHGFANLTALSPAALSAVEDTAQRMGKALKRQSRSKG
ncbi:hypothetical protein MNBD_ALPHA06-2200 [hydrothermal vent metagenome]|uniref:Alpha/beta hydrolase fold-3 domain-containing protein n=1 Tax=hydrothermal vent metagenome TaxID=652676 RepID=A0A3B0S821_9ZZZZ